MQPNSDLARRLNFKRIPVLPPGAPYLLKALLDDDIGFSDLAAVIARYPSITARLIALANSAWSSPVNEISSLESACARLGMDIVRSTCIALAVSSPFQYGRCPAFDAEQFWTSALLAADGAAWLTTCSKATQLEPATARAAGLIHNLGLLWLADQLAQELDEAIGLAYREGGMTLGQALQNRLGFNHCDVGKRLGMAWNLPESLVSAMANHADEDRQQDTGDSANLVGISVSMVRSLQRNRPWPIPQRRLEQLHIVPADAIDVLGRLSAQMPEIHELAKILFVR